MKSSDLNVAKFVLFISVVCSPGHSFSLTLLESVTITLQLCTTPLIHCRPVKVLGPNDLKCKLCF